MRSSSKQLTCVADNDEVKVIFYRNVNKQYKETINLISEIVLHKKQLTVQKEHKLKATKY